MIAYELPTDPNFKMSFAPESNEYIFTFRYFQGITYITITDSDGNRIAGPIKACNGEWLIQTEARKDSDEGNFTMIDKNGHYPQFRNFGKSCELRYYTKSEIYG